MIKKTMYIIYQSQSNVETTQPIYHLIRYNFLITFYTWVIRVDVILHNLCTSTVYGYVIYNYRH